MAAKYDPNKPLNYKRAQGQVPPSQPAPTNTTAPTKLIIECAALLSHVQMLEARLIDKDRGGPKDGDHFGHPQAPQLHMCRIPNPDKPGTDLPVVAVLAITKRCASAQLLKEAVGFAAIGAPVEVLVMSGEDQVNCATLIALEQSQLSADDTMIVPEHGDGNGTKNNANNSNNRHSYDNEGHHSAVVSLMSGGIVPVAPSPRVAVIVGTTHSRIISIEFSVKAKTMRLVRRNHLLGEEVLAYFEPLPKNVLTDHQKIQIRMPGQGARDPYGQSSASAGGNATTRQESSSMILTGEGSSRLSFGGGGGLGGAAAAAAAAAASSSYSNSHFLAIKKGKRIVPLEPTGGVKSIQVYTSRDLSNNPNNGDNLHTSGLSRKQQLQLQQRPKEKTHLWISYGDGTAIRLHHAGFFPSVIQKHSESASKGGNSTVQYQPLESVVGDSVVRFQLKLPPLVDTEVTMLPCPKYHPSPLAPYPRFTTPDFHNDDEMMLGGAALLGNDNTQEEIPDMHEAVVYCKGAMADAFPTVAFYTSEDQEASNLVQGDPLDKDAAAQNLPVVNNVLEAVIGGIFGFFGGGGNGDDKKDSEAADAEKVQREISRKPPKWDPKIPFSSMNYEPTALYAGYEIHDPPRQITFCSIDPDGDLAAAADTLGRVSLIDLSTKQVIRMWKGYRDTQCHWIQVPQTEKGKTKQKTSAKTKVLYLVIHSRQRKILEIWRTRNGPKVLSMQVGRDAQIIPCRELTPVGYVWRCYLAHSTVPFSNMNQVEKIVVKEDEHSTTLNTNTSGTSASHTSQRNTTKASSSSKRQDAIQLSQEAAVRLNRLQQLLGDTNIPCQGIDVYKALENINSLKDLATALDLLAVAPALEEKMAVQGSEFQRLALVHCKEKLNDAIKSGGRETLTNPNVQLLAFKISYFTQVAAAYDTLRKFERGTSEEADEVTKKTKSRWALEAVGWTTTQEQITGKSIDADLPATPKEPLKFYTLANACVPPRKWQAGPQAKDGGYRVYLSDSSKTRRDVLIHIFEPLLGDVFAFNTVNQIFEHLGIKNDYDYMAKCFGEWFMSLSLKEETEKGMISVKSPISRWLQTIAGHQLESEASEGEPRIILDSVHKFCAESDDLVRAFWLGTLCRDSVAEAAKQKEEKTYGKISSSNATKDWDSLLRRLRVCLLVQLRLFGIRLGACPLSIRNVEEDGNFSILQWVAYDELAMSHKHEEIVTLENACKISNLAFDPTTSEGDDPARFKVLQNSCLAAALSEAERSEYLVDFDDDDRLGALLLYLQPYNIGDLLLFHRVLLLAAKWAKDPKDMEILKDAIETMKHMNVTRYKNIAAAVRVEVWQTIIRPVYRALLVGFDDVQEISAEVVGPLFDDAAWVTSFGKLASEILVLMAHLSEEVKVPNTYTKTEMSGGDGTSWPPKREDFMLKRLVQRSRPLNSEAVDAHRVLICALLLSQDIQTLSDCIPSFYDLFLPNAMFSPVVPLADADDKQHAFMQDAIVQRAREYIGPSLDTLSLGVIDILAVLWDFDLKNVKTLFLLSMYEFGKDRIVDELLTKSAPHISVKHFCEDGVDIACRRLNDLLHVNPPPEIRKIMGLLDADMCEWIRERAEGSQPLVHGTLKVPVGNTHLFVLRLLSLAAVAEVRKEERIKIHSLIVLSGTLVKSMEHIET